MALSEDAGTHTLHSLRLHALIPRRPHAIVQRLERVVVDHDPPLLGHRAAKRLGQRESALIDHGVARDIDGAQVGEVGRSRWWGVAAVGAGAAAVVGAAVGGAIREHLHGAGVGHSRSRAFGLHRDQHIQIEVGGVIDDGGLAIALVG